MKELVMKEITSKDHPLIKHFMKLRVNRDYRHECRRVIVEGDKLVRDVIEHCSFHHLLTLDPHVPCDPVHVTVVSDDLMKKVSGMNTPPKLMAEVDLPEESSLKGLKKILALDRLQDPGNVGTLFRTVRALGWEGIFIIGDAVDPFNDKALRASQGTSLFVPYRLGTLEDFKKWVKEEGHQVVVADMEGEAPKKNFEGCLILGQEGKGISPELKEFSAVTIPMQTGVESLNVAVAGAILMYAMGQSA